MHAAHPRVAGIILRAEREIVGRGGRASDATGRGGRAEVADSEIHAGVVGDLHVALEVGSRARTNDIIGGNRRAIHSAVKQRTYTHPSRRGNAGRGRTCATDTSDER